MYVVGYPKSGNTWLCFLLAYCLNAEYDDLDAPGIHPTNEYQRRYVKGGLEHTSYQERVGKILKTHSQNIPEISPDDLVIYLVRDGRDVMVSYFFFQNTYFNPRNFPPLKRLLFQTKQLLTTNSPDQFPQQNFSAFLRQYTDEWLTHISAWLARKPTAIIRYEDLKTNPHKTLEELFNILNIQISPEIIDRALCIFDFKQLAKRKEGEEDRKSFFRKGIVGDWQNHFSPEDLEYFHHKAAKVMKQLNYE